MRKGSDVIGKPVVAAASGRQAQRVADIVYDPQRTSVAGLVLDNGGWFNSVHTLPFERVKSIGEDAVMIETEAAVVASTDEPFSDQGLEMQRDLKGLRVLTESGEFLGVLDDLAFNEVTGAVEGYELSGGLLADVFSGRGMIPASMGLRLGKDVALVPDEVIDYLKQNPGGVKGAAQSAAQAVTGDRARQAATGTRDAVQEHAKAINDQAHDFWETAKDKTAQYTGLIGKEVEERRIRSALGRPVRRVILDRNDQPILSTGELITHQAVEQAREAGVLDMLLNSVGSEA